MASETLLNMTTANLEPARYVGVSTATLLVYDYILTFEREARLIWQSRWSVVKILFLLTRYLPFLSISFVLFRDHNYSLSESSCRIIISLSGFILIAGIGLSEAILFVRTWALWNRSHGVAVVLGIIFVASSSAVVVIERTWLKSLNISYSAGLGAAGCFIIDSSSIIAADLGVIIFMELTVIVLTAIHVARQYRALGRETFRGGIGRVLYRDVVVFFLHMFMISLANLLSVTFGPNSVKNILIDLQHVLHSALAARVLFNLREATDGLKTSDGEVSSQMASRLVFVPRSSCSS